MSKFFRVLASLFKVWKRFMFHGIDRSHAIGLRVMYAGIGVIFLGGAVFGWYSLDFHSLAIDAEHWGEYAYLGYNALIGLGCFYLAYRVRTSLPETADLKDVWDLESS